MNELGGWNWSLCRVTWLGPMVLISDDNSEIGAHVRSDPRYLIYFRHLVRLKAGKNGFFSPEIPTTLHACASYSEWPYSISGMVGCSGYHLIRAFVMVFIELRWETFAGHGIYEHNPNHNSCIQFTVGCSYCLYKKSCPFIYSESLYKNMFLLRLTLTVLPYPLINKLLKYELHLRYLPWLRHYQTKYFIL